MMRQLGMGGGSPGAVYTYGRARHHLVHAKGPVLGIYYHKRQCLTHLQSRRIW